MSDYEAHETSICPYLEGGPMKIPTSGKLAVMCRAKCPWRDLGHQCEIEINDLIVPICTKVGVIENHFLAEDDERLFFKQP